MTLTPLTMGQHVDQEAFDTVVIDDIPYPVTQINFTDLSRFETKVTIGDYSRESDQLLSSWIQSSWSGGAMVDDHIEGATDSRFRFSTLWTRSPGQLTLPPEFHHVAEVGSDLANATDIRVIGDYDDSFYVSADGDLIEIEMNPANCPNFPLRPSTNLGPLNGNPVGRGVQYRGVLYIPLGHGGYATFDGTTIATETDPEVQSFCLWDNKLGSLSVTGFLQFFDGTTWDAEDEQKQLPSDRKPRHLVWFYDREGETTVFLVTDRDMWVYDTEAEVIHASRLQLPPHSANGLAACQWRDDALYYASGLGVYRYTGSGTISATGLDRDDGMPTRIMHHLGNQQFGFAGGKIIDLVPEHNMVIAHVQGDTSIDTSPLPQDGEWEAGPFEGGQYLTATPPIAWSAIMAWNEAGWHCLRVSDHPTNTQAPTHPSLYVSTAADQYQLFAVEDGVLRQTFLSREFFGPRQVIQRNTDAVGPEYYAKWFQDGGFHETGWFDAGMQGFDKIADRLEVNIWNPGDGIGWEGPEPNATPQPVIRVYYRTDDSPNTWTHLGDVTRYGTTAMFFGKDGDGFGRGLSFNKIEFRYVFDNGPFNQHRPPVIDSTVFKFLKIPHEGRSWVMTVDLDFEGTFMGFGPEELRDELTRHTTSHRFAKMILNGKPWRVRISQVQGGEMSGHFSGKMVQLSVLHVPEFGRE